MMQHKRGLWRSKCGLCAAIAAIALAAADSVYAADGGPTILRPQGPPPAAPSYKTLTPAAENPSHFVARAKHFLELVRRKPAAPSVGGTASHIYARMPPEALDVLQREAAPFDRNVRDRMLKCGKPNLNRAARSVLLELDSGGITVPVFMTSEADALRYYEISIDQPGDPVVVVITSYQGVAARITPSARTTIAAVHVHSYDPSVILGVDLSRVTSQYLPRADSACDYGSSERKAPQIVQDLGLDPARVLRFPVRDDRGYQLAVGAPVAARRDAPRLGSYLDPEMPLPHSFGIVALEALGYIRPAKASAGRNYSGGGYEVLKPFRIPDGLAGGHSVTFVVPRGGAVPSGELGHSSIVQW